MSSRVIAEPRQCRQTGLLALDDNAVMRPEILNPLFTEVEALKGVGPQLAKPLKRLGIGAGRRPALSSADRRDRAGPRRRRRSAALLGRNVILDLTPFDIRESRSGRGPMRVFAADGDGNTISLIYFNNPGLGEAQPADRASRGPSRASSRRMATNGRSSIPR